MTDDFVGIVMRVNPIVAPQIVLDAAAKHVREAEPNLRAELLPKFDDTDAYKYALLKAGVKARDEFFEGRSMTPIFKKGHVFKGPDHQGYVLLCDVKHGDAFLPSQFEAFGGAPEPKSGHLLPSWLDEQTRPVLYGAAA